MLNKITAGIVVVSLSIGAAFAAFGQTSTPLPSITWGPTVANSIPNYAGLVLNTPTPFTGRTISSVRQGTTATLGPSGCGTILDGWTFNCIWMNGDSVTPANAAKSLLTLYYTVNGGTGTGNPFPLNAVTEVTAMPTTATISTFFGATQFLGHGGVASGGAIGSNFFSDPQGIGNIYGIGVYAELDPNASGWRSLTGNEMDIKTQTGSSVEARVGLDIVSGPDKAQVQGSLIDAALVIDNGGRGGPFGNPVGWGNAIQVGYFNEANNNPISTGGRILTTFTGVATALDTGIDISVAWQSGLVFTYTGDFFKANNSNHWTGLGEIIATSTGVNHDFVRSTNGSVASFENSGGFGASVSISPRTAGQQASIFLSDAGTAKWQLGKHTDNTFFLFDSVAGKNALTVGAGTAGQVVLGETGGSQLTLVPSGGAILTSIATTGDGTGLYVCQNASDGKLYRKSACP